MNKNKLFLFAAMAGMAFTLPQLKGNPVVAHASIDEQLTVKTIYEENFEGYNLNDNADAIWANGQKLIWIEGSAVTPVIKNYYGSKAIEYTVTTNSEYSTFGGIGTGEINNLAKLTDGEWYDFYIDVRFQSVTNYSSATFYADYQNSYWQSVNVNPDGTYNIDGTIVKNVNYYNGTLRYTFQASKYQGSNSWIKLVGKNLVAGDIVAIDNIKITKNYTAYANNWQSYSSGTGYLDVYGLYNADVSSVTIGEDGINRFVLADGYADTEGVNKWSKMYFNEFDFLTSGNTYRLECDIIEMSNVDEFYICYNEGGQPCVTYGPEGYRGQDNSERIIAGTFDGTHLTFTFKADSAISEWWRQVAIVIRHNTHFTMKFDNLVIYNFGTVVDYAKQFIEQFKALLTENGETLSLCDHIGVGIDNELDAVLDLYNDLSDTDKLEARSEVLWTESGENYTIGQMLDYAATISASINDKIGGSNVGGLAVVNVISNSNSASSSIVLLIILSTIAISAYYVIEKLNRKSKK